MFHPKAEQLFKKLNPLRGKIPIYTFDFIISSLFLLRHLNEEFKKEQEKLNKEGKGFFAEDKDFYHENALCFLEKEARWNEIIRLSRNENIGNLLDRAFNSLEQNNEHIKGILPTGFFTSPNIEAKDLNTFLSKISSIYEEMDRLEFLEAFQDYLNLCAEERSKYESRVEKNKKHTPIVIAKLLVALADPYEGNIYDPCFGTAGLLVEANKHIKQKKQTMDNVFFFGQELSSEMHRFARINQAINGCEFKLGEEKSTFADDIWKSKKMDYVLANFPMNQKNWRDSEGLSEGAMWQIFGTPPEKNGNWAWVSFIIHKLSEEGVATFLIPQRELDNKDSKKFRKGIVEKDLIEAVILLPKRSVYDDDILLAILVINKNKGRKRYLANEEKIYRNRSKEVLFIDASQDKGISDEKLEWIIKIFNSWRYEDEKFTKDDLCKSLSYEEIRNKEYSLSFTQYSVFVERKIQNIQKIEELVIEKKRIEKHLIELFKGEKWWKERFKEMIGSRDDD